MLPVESQLFCVHSCWSSMIFAQPSPDLLSMLPKSVNQIRNRQTLNMEGLFARLLAKIMNLNVKS